MSSSTSSPSRHERDVLAARLAVARQLADELREAGDDPAHRHHRQAHGAVADARPAGPARPRRGPSSSRAGGTSWSPSGDQAVQRRRAPRVGWLAGAAARARRSARPSAVVGGQRRRARGRAASTRRRRARPRRRRRAGRARVGWGRGPSRRPRGRPRVVVVGRVVLGRPAAGTVDGVVAGDGAVERGDDGGELVGADRALGARQRAADALGGHEQQVDEVLADGEPAVAQRAEQVLGPVGDVDDAVEAEHPGRALDGVRVAEQARDQLPRRRVRLEPQQPLAQRGEPLLDLRAEGRDQLRVVGPAVHDRPCQLTRNCAIDDAQLGGERR